MISTNCPNCNSPSGKVGAYDFATPDGEQLIRWQYINCRSCGYTTKSTPDLASAEQEWNDAVNGT